MLPESRPYHVFQSNNVTPASGNVRAARSLIRRVLTSAVIWPYYPRDSPVPLDRKVRTMRLHSQDVWSRRKSTCLREFACLRLKR